MSGTPDVIKHHRPLTRPRFLKGPKGRKPIEKRQTENNDDDDDEEKKLKAQITALEKAAADKAAADKAAADKAAADKAAADKAAADKAAEDKASEEKEDNKETTDVEIPEGEPTTSETINITGRKFEIRYDKANRARRAEVFTGKSKKKLTETEEEVLKAIGITKDTRNELLPYLADFFNSLPSCQSSSQMLTNRRCEIAYYIMWSVLLKARQATQAKIDEQEKAGITDLDTHQIAASVDAMSSIKTTISGQNHSEHMEIIDIVTRIENNLKEVKTAVNSLPKKGGGLSEMNRLFRKRSRV